MSLPELSELHWLFNKRALWAALAMGGWLMLCWICLGKSRRPAVIKPAAAPDWLIAYASQSGAAREIAERLAPAFHQSNLTTILLPLNAIQPRALAGYSRALLIVSTYGEGEAPDNAAAFWRKAEGVQPDLSKLNYSMLALGDDQYADFCGFGRRLTHWLNAAGATAATPCQEVSRLDPDSIQSWSHQASAWTGVPLYDAGTSGSFKQWRLLERLQLNPNSPGSPAWLIRLAPVADRPIWQAGDLAQLSIGSALRTYSIASLPEDGVLELIVRQVVSAQGVAGHGSGWLCCHAELGATVDVRLQSNPTFHLPERDGPGIFIGAGTGLAGLRGLLRQRQHQGRADNWLIFGERCLQHDLWLTEELDTWTAQGKLLLDRCFSRAEHRPEYVQHRLAAKADQLRQWVDRGASIHVCGSLAGMGREIHRLLQELLTAEQWQELQQQQRYRRDLY